MSSSWKKRAKEALLTTLVVASAFSCGKKGGPVDPVDPSHRLTATATITPQTGVNVGDEYVLSVEGDGLDAELGYNIQGTLPDGRDTVLTGVAQPTTATNYAINHTFKAKQAGNASFVVNLEDSELYNSAADKVTTAASIKITENIPGNTPVDTSFTAPKNVLTGDEVSYRLQINDVDNGGGSIFETLPDGSTKESMYSVPFDSTFTNTFSVPGTYSMRILFEDNHPVNVERKEFNLQTAVAQAMENRKIVVQANNEQTGVGLAGKTVKLYFNGSEIDDLVLDETGCGSFDITVPEGSAQTYSVGVLAHGYTDEQTDIVSDEAREDVVFYLTPSAITLINPSEINPWSTGNVLDVTSIYASTDFDTGDEVALVSSAITSLDSRLELIKQGNSYQRNLVGDANNENIGIVVNVSSESNSLEQTLQQAIDAKELVNQVQSVVNGNEGTSVDVDMKEYFESNVDLLSMNFSSPNVQVTDLGNFVYRFNQDAAFFGNIDVDAEIVNIERETLDTVMSYIVAEAPKLSVEVFNTELRAKHTFDGLRTVLRVIQGTDSTQYISEDGSFQDIPVLEGPLTTRAYFIDNQDSVQSFMRTRRFDVNSSLDVDMFTVPYKYYDENFQETTLNGESALRNGVELAGSPKGFQKWKYAIAKSSTGGMTSWNLDSNNRTTPGSLNTWQCNEDNNAPSFAVVADSAYFPARNVNQQQRSLDDRTRNFYIQNWAFMDQALWGELPDVQRVSYIEIDEENNQYPCYVVMVGRNDGNNGATRGYGRGDSELVQVISEAISNDPGTSDENIQGAVAQEMDPIGSAVGADSNNYTSLTQSITNDFTPLTQGTPLDMKGWRANLTRSLRGEQASDIYVIPIHTNQ